MDGRFGIEESIGLTMDDFSLILILSIDYLDTTCMQIKVIIKSNFSDGNFIVYLAYPQCPKCQRSVQKKKLPTIGRS